MSDSIPSMHRDEYKTIAVAVVTGTSLAALTLSLAVDGLSELSLWLGAVATVGSMITYVRMSHDC